MDSTSLGGDSNPVLTLSIEIKTGSSDTGRTIYTSYFSQLSRRILGRTWIRTGPP